MTNKSKLNTIKNYEKKIMKANQRLGNLYKSFGGDSPIYQAYKTEIEQEFASINHSDMISKGPTGAIKIDKKRAAYEVAYMRLNERKLFSGTIGSVPTVTELKKEAANKLGISPRKITNEQIEEITQVDRDIKAALQAFYNLLSGDDYRKILLPEIYKPRNHGNIDVDEVKSLIAFYEMQGTEFIKTATAEQLEYIRREALKSL